MSQDTRLNGEVFREFFEAEDKEKLESKMDDRLIDLKQKGHELEKRTFYENLREAMNDGKL